MSYISEAHCTCFCTLSDIFTEKLNFQLSRPPPPIPRVMLLGNPQKSDVLCFPDCLVRESVSILCFSSLLFRHAEQPTQPVHLQTPPAAAAASARLHLCQEATPSG